jgi:hypothetical protein
MRHKELVRQATDHEVCQAINALRNNIPWRTILARMILWGLRPHEAFKGMVLADGGYQVSDDTKTGGALRTKKWSKAQPRKSSWDG